MALKAVNLKMEEKDIRDVKKIASVFGMTTTEVFKEAVSEYVVKMMNDPFYRLTANVQNASEEETEEILTEIGKMTDDDLSIASVKTVTV